MSGKQSYIIFKIFSLLLVISLFFTAIGKNKELGFPYFPGIIPVDTPQNDTTSLPYPIEDKRYATPGDDKNAFDLEDPDIIEKSIEYDPSTGEYEIKESFGDRSFRNPSYYSFEEYLEKQGKKDESDYWRQRAEAESLLERKGLIPELDFDSKAFEGIFGSSKVDIRPQGHIDLRFGGTFQNMKNPTLPEKRRKHGAFDFNMNIQMNVVGKVGDKLKVTTNYNTQSTFNFQNQVKLEYTGYEDEIIKKIEAGNVSLPLSTSLITGSQSLFGIKTQLQFGRLTVTSLLSQQKSEKKEIVIEGGAQMQEFEVEADDYDENRHFFLSHYFRENFNDALSQLPVIKSSIEINKVEVWVTNKTGATDDTRDIVAFMDLGENENYADTRNYLPRNGNLYKTLTSNANANIRNSENAISILKQELRMEARTEFEKTYARKLSPSEYRLNPKLGYISLNQSLNPDEVLAVSFEYTKNGEVFQVGEFASDIPPNPQKPNVLFLKMLKSTTVRPDLPLWDLMMKNIYALGAYQVNREDFKLDVFYQDPGGGEKRYIPEGDIKGIPLITVLNLDNLNNQNDPTPDGVFDFVPGITINPSNGRVIFPVAEPFGDHLRNQFSNDNLADNFVYDQLYDSTKTVAEEFPEFNRYLIKGRYKSSVSSEISLGVFNIPQNSVIVTAGGQELTENVDYTIDYNLGRIKIINEGIMNSGQQIKVNFEDDLFGGLQMKTLFGTRFDYWISDNFTLGATYMHLSERPFTRKVNIGEEPISNAIYGFDGNYFKEAPWLTKAIDKLPLFNTKEESSITISGEYARLDPGHSKAISKDGKGNAYIDDFEGTQTSYDLKFPYSSWELSSTPSGATDENGRILFPEADSSRSLVYGTNRARLAWYNIDPLFLRNNSATPDHIKQNKNLQSSHYVREILQKEVFPNKDEGNFQQSLITTFDMAFYPDERGPYNFDTENVNSDGTLKNPKDRWGGIMRRIETTDFEAANIEFIEFWVMDPFLENENNSGELYINLGNVSEDILKDGRKFFENGLPKENNPAQVDTTVWGRVPVTQSIVNAFDNDPAAREKQDVGLDGLDDNNEQSFHKEYLEKIKAIVSGSVYQSIEKDPSNDNYHYYRGADFDQQERGILERYKQYNNPQGNSPVADDDEFSSSATQHPNSEDLNNDNTLNETEDYFQYRIKLHPDMKVGKNYVTDKITTEVDLRNGNSDSVTWYQFKIPVKNYDRKVGNIQDFKSIRFIRMFLTDFSDSVFCRFASFDLVRNQWRKYRKEIREPGVIQPDDNTSTTFFNVSSVNIEENASREPVNYVLPPGIEREDLIGQGSVGNVQQNEQALSVQVCDLEDGTSKAIYKTINLDIRKFKRLNMFIHAESAASEKFTQDNLQDDDLTAFIRLGGDFTENYYEYEVPLKVTPAGFYTSSDPDRLAVWPEENEVNIPLDSLVIVKNIRNNSNTPFNKPFEFDIEGGHTITVVGSPDLSLVKTVMIGIRNPEARNDSEDDGLPKCAEIWFNELRLSDFDEKGGWAAVARADAKLADLGNVTVSGSIRTIGFGSLEQSLAERSTEDNYQYSASTNLQLGKLFPEKAGIMIPMYAGISNSISRPQYDPYESDILLNDMLASIDTAQGDSARKAYLDKVQDFNSVKSLNFSNIRKVKTGGGKNKDRIYDIENLNLTLAFNEQFRRNPTVQSDKIQQYKAELGYNYNISPKYFSPFEKVFKPNNKFFKLIRDINFNPLPGKLSVRNSLNRKYGETVLRSLGDEKIPMDTLFDKAFNWDRFYGYQQNLTKNLTFDFNAANRARIDEPEGKIDTDEKKDSIMENLKNFGRTTDYNHSVNVNYKVPIDKLPFMDWINLKAGYSGNYSWIAAPLGNDSLGNTIRNANNKQLNGEFNLKSFYNKFKFLRDYNRPKRPSRSNQKGKGKGKNDEEDKTAAAAITGNVAGFFIRSLLSLKRVSLTYSESRNSLLPGYKPGTDLFGMNFEDANAPQLAFIAGIQDTNFLERAWKNKWLMTDTNLSYQFVTDYSQDISGRASIEPLNDLRINVNFNRSLSRGNSQYFIYDEETDILERFNQVQSGNFTMTFNTFRTMFDSKDENDIPATFRQFEDNRSKISERLAEENEFSQGVFEDTITNQTFYDGYGPYSQDVLIPAFIAAYTGQGTDEVGLQLSDYFKMLPKPNWRLTYNGLSKIKFLQKIFSNVNITHGYISGFSINSYRTDLNYEEVNEDPAARDTIGGNNFISKFEVPGISISEQLSPLIGVDITWKNGLTTRLEYKRSRTLSMSFINYQLNERTSSEITIGGGLRKRGITLPIKSRGKKITLENDLNFKMDFSYMANETVIYQLDQDIAQPTSGSKIITIAPSIDYVVNNRLNIQLFFNKKYTIPVTSSTYPITNTSAGVNVRFTIGQ